MYLNLIPKLKTIFEAVVIHEITGGDDLKLDVYPYPLSEGEYPSKYPALVFFPSDYTNEFSSGQTNFKNIKFKAILMMDAKNISGEDLYTFTLPNAADKLSQALDKEWDMGRIDNKRVWMMSDVAIWGKYSEDNSDIAFVDLDILIKMETKVE